mmetsp:Transcript_39479/g.113916  ORF Transcript_39479/g.113916 Transcript_39479/m.113916 type:complete len:226 (-) Transcript_39479:102-779(-)
MATVNSAGPGDSPQRRISSKCSMAHSQSSLSWQSAIMPLGLSSTANSRPLTHQASCDEPSGCPPGSRRSSMRKRSPGLPSSFQFSPWQSPSGPSAREGSAQTSDESAAGCSTWAQSWSTTIWNSSASPAKRTSTYSLRCSELAPSPTISSKAQSLQLPTTKNLPRPASELSASLLPPDFVGPSSSRRRSSELPPARRLARHRLQPLRRAAGTRALRPPARKEGSQ